MTDAFIKIFNMSINASWIALAVFVLRAVFKKAPKWIICLLWVVVGIRLVMPISFKSILSLLPSTQTLPQDFAISQKPQINSGIPAFNNAINPIITESLSPDTTVSANPLQIILFVATVVWALGIIAMLVYTLISYFRLSSTVKASLLIDENVYRCDDIDTPFILGIIKPKIYLPSSLNQTDAEYVISHEKAHLKRFDHLWKPFAFLLLSIYWFNPLMWVSFVLLCRDIEIACDQKVVKQMSEIEVRGYLNALVSCSVNRKMISACPLAFGEVGVKQRVKNILNYKKPAFWVVITSVALSIVLSVCFLTDPKNESVDYLISAQKSLCELDGLTIKINDLENAAPSPYINVVWENNSTKSLYFDERFYVYYDAGDGTWEDVNLTNDYSFYNGIMYEVGVGSKAEIKYYLNGFSMSIAGKYRIETECFDKVSNYKYKAAIEFELKKGVDVINVNTYTPVELYYDDGSYSFVQTPDVAPTYRIVNDMELQEIGNDGVVNSLGVLSEITLNEENFDSRLHQNGWIVKFSTSGFRKDNIRAWQLYCSSGEDSYNPLYMLFEQNDGTYYIAIGYYNCKSNNPTNKDDSKIRWLYKLSTDVSKVTNANTIEAVIGNTNGIVFYYKQATPESEVPVIYSYNYFNNDTLNKFLLLLKEQKWVCDALVDRTSFNFNGYVYYDGKIYFDYENSVIYYDEYFCTVNENILNIVKQLQDSAEKFETMISDGFVYTYNNSSEPYLKPSFILRDNKTFSFTWSYFSSYLCIGEYELDNNKLVMKTSDGLYKFVFKSVNGDFVFDAEKSSKIPEYKYSGVSEETQSPVPDGAVFKIKTQ